MWRFRTAAAPRSILVWALVVSGCSQYEAFDSVSYLRQQYAQRLGEAASGLEVPFALDDELQATVLERVQSINDDRRQAEEVVEFIFGRLDLEYSPAPTLSAAETFRQRRGNCLSFVNLYVGVARELGLQPFYVEVVDQQRWSHRQGLVVSQGHIVAGLYLEGELETFDFLPYRPKAYRDFKPIDDLTAAAHYYNNLGAEALLAGDLEAAEVAVRRATDLAPEFVKALNNLGVVQARRGDFEAALATYRRGLGLEPDNLGLLSNMARAYQQSGRGEAAQEVMTRLEGIRQTNPYFLVSRGEIALARGDSQEALEFMVRAFRIDSEAPRVHVGLTKVYLALGDTERARHHLERALRLDATDEEARRLARAMPPPNNG